METAPFGAVKPVVRKLVYGFAFEAAMETAPFGAVKRTAGTHDRYRQSSRNGDRSFRSGEVAMPEMHTHSIDESRNGDRSFRSGEAASPKACKAHR